MTREIHAVAAPTTSTNRSMRARTPRAAGAPDCCPGSGATDLAVIDRFAVTGPRVVLGLEREVRVVDFLRDRVLGDALLQHLAGRGAQALHHVVRERPGDDALVLDEVLHRL